MTHPTAPQAPCPKCSDCGAEPRIDRAGWDGTWLCGTHLCAGNPVRSCRCELAVAKQQLTTLKEQLDGSLSNKFIQQWKLRAESAEAELASIREELAHMRTSEAIQDRDALRENVAALQDRVSRRTDAEVAATNILTFLNTQKFHGLPIILEEFGCDAAGFRSTVKAIANCKETQRFCRLLCASTA